MLKIGKYMPAVAAGVIGLAIVLWWMQVDSDKHRTHTASNATTPNPLRDTGEGQAVRQTEVAWFKGTLEAAFAKAKAESKPVLLFWGAAWCPYCQALHATVFKRPDFIEQSAHVIAVDLDGDLPDAQKAGAKFKVIGYPTLILFKPDGTEITRVSGGMNLEQYASILKDTLRDERPISQVLLAATALTPPATITAQDCRRLGFHAWDLEPDAESPLGLRATQLTIAAERCPESEPISRARLNARAIAILVQTQSESLGQGKPATPELRTRIKEPLAALLMDPNLVRGTADILSSFDDALYVVIKNEGPEFTEKFRSDWVNALQFAAHDTHYGESERLLALATALNGEQQLRSDHAVPESMAKEAREQTQTALSHSTAAANRHDIINAARIIYTVLGDDKALYDMLVQELPKTQTAYYYMPTLASIQEKQGNTKQALSWLEMAYAATTTPGAKAKWGTTYLRGLMRMTPDDTVNIEKIATEVADAMRERDAQLPPSTDRSKRFVDALAKWATNPTRRQIALAVQKRLLS